MMQPNESRAILVIEFHLPYAFFRQWNGSAGTVCHAWTSALMADLEAHDLKAKFYRNPPDGDPRVDWCIALETCELGDAIDDIRTTDAILCVLSWARRRIADIVTQALEKAHDAATKTCDGFFAEHNARECALVAEMPGD